MAGWPSGFVVRSFTIKIGCMYDVIPIVCHGRGKLTYVYAAVSKYGLIDNVLNFDDLK